MAKLYVVATPIGNLQDFSPRGIETLRAADIIVAEDTRVTMKLCQVFDIHTRLISCHRHNEDTKGLRIAERIAEEDLTAALTTDAGTPCISDPGNELVKACLDRGVEVLPVPGCCAGIAALSISGFDAREFAFYGFLPRGKKELREKLTELAGGPRQKRHQIAIYPAGFAADELGDIGVLLLGHDGRAGGKAIIHLDEAELIGIPEDQLLTEAGEMHHGDGRGGKIFQEEIPIRDAIETVFGNRGEIEQLRDPGTIERIGGAGQGP